jgi:malonyl-CoA O-methyltransferase
MLRWLTRLRRQPITLDVVDAYARWASTYSPDAHTPLMRLEQQAVLDVLPDPAGLRALDLACGSGRYLRVLIERGAALAVALDLSRPMLGRARSLSPLLACADMLHLPLPASTFDLVVCGLAVGHAADLACVLSEAARVLAHDGILVYSDLHPFGALAGWRRSFRGDDGREYVVRHHTHRLADHQAACRAAGLRVEAVREPTIDFDHEWRGAPAAIVVRARQPG